MKLSLIAFAALLVAFDLSSAWARGGYPMNTPGYQRRLQESRGYASNRSGSWYASQHNYRSRYHKR
jgi:hypothetical protein